uniref:Uncharacterized protein n=1 Tax=Mucochytrium quahogii TaxID=96639 RepID=A0A7S2WEQ7_9STRA|mmetsp:Transcript_20862/g.45555  ORF Transcript_20862/g.45555 Transcript_20862/m.45555 type:complete len:585 (+) Transcript_20862:144-1898(+)
MDLFTDSSDSGNESMVSLLDNVMESPRTPRRRPLASAGKKSTGTNVGKAKDRRAVSSRLLSIQHRRSDNKENAGSKNGMITPAVSFKAMDTAKRRTRVKSQPELTKTNFTKMKRELAVHHEKYEMLANKVAELSEQRALKARDKNLRKVILAVVLGIMLYLLYVMLVPHFNAVFMAGLLSLVLHSVLRPLMHLIDTLRISIHDVFKNQRTMLLGAMVILAIATGVSVTRTTIILEPLRLVAVGLMSLTAASILFLVLVLTVDSRALAAGTLTLLVICVMCVPLFFVLQQCVKEIEIITTFVRNVIDSDDALQTTVESIVNSRLYSTLHEYTNSLVGTEVIPSEIKLVKEDLKSDLRGYAELLGANLQRFSGNVISFASNLSNVLWAFTTFSTTLYYLLRNETCWELFDALSPLSPQDNAELCESIKMSTGRILLCASCIGMIHAAVMYILLAFSGFQLVAIPSFICGIVAVLPLWGTYVVFVPVAMMLWVQESHVFSILVCIVEIFLILIVDAKITSYIPGDSHFVGLSIVAGLYAFGLFGFVYGPLLVGLTSCIVNIYLKYMQKPPSYKLFSPIPTPRKQLFQ